MSRRALLTAVLCPLLALPAAAPPATAATSCTAVTGTMTDPRLSFDLRPGLREEPVPQTVSIRPMASVTVALTCVRAAGAATFTGVLLPFGRADGASFGGESLTNGVGSAYGSETFGFGLATSGGAGSGSYGTSAEVATTLGFTYVRAGATIAIVVTLGGLVVDLDGPGPLPADHWGDVPLASLGAVLPYPGYVVDDYVSGHGLRMREFQVQQVAAAAAATS